MGIRKDQDIVFTWPLAPGDGRARIGDPAFFEALKGLATRRLLSSREYRK